VFSLFDAQVDRLKAEGSWGQTIPAHIIYGNGNIQLIELVGFTFLSRFADFSLQPKLLRISLRFNPFQGGA
jgi:hypothetical protein